MEATARWANRAFVLLQTGLVARDAWEASAGEPQTYRIGYTMVKTASTVGGAVGGGVLGAKGGGVVGGAIGGPPGAVIGGFVGGVGGGIIGGIVGDKVGDWVIERAG